MTTTTGQIKTSSAFELAKAMFAARGHSDAGQISMFVLAAKVVQVKTWMRGLTADGRRNWEGYRRVSKSFINTRDRLQFLTLAPGEFREIRQFAEFPEEVFAKFGIAKLDFLDFTGFARLCMLDKNEQIAGRLEKDINGLTVAEEAVKAKSCRKILAEIRERITAPAIPDAKAFPSSVEKFRRLSAANSSPGVFISLDHPKYIWILCEPMPGRFAINNPKYGKWVVNFKDGEGPFAAALKLLPHFAKRQLGELKFELTGREEGIFTIIVYAQDRDPLVREMVHDAAGKEPFWVPDEFCYEAQALGDVMQELLMKIDVSRKWDPSLVGRLRDYEFCRSRGISDIQAEILWRVFNADKPEYQDPDTDYAHVVIGYFTGADKQLKEGLGIKSDNDRFMKTMLPVIFADENREIVHSSLIKSREKFLKDYHAS